MSRPLGNRSTKKEITLSESEVNLIDLALCELAKRPSRAFKELDCDEAGLRATAQDIIGKLYPDDEVLYLPHRSEEDKGW